MKYYGNVTYVIQKEDPDAPGNWIEEVIVRPYKGEWMRYISKWTPGKNINDDKRVNNQLEIISDSFVSVNFMHIRYIEWKGVKWAVNTATLRPPRVVLEIGDIYNA